MPRLLMILPLLVLVGANSSRRCIHGSIHSGKCECDDSYTGQYCHREMHCDGFTRQKDGSCFECKTGWLGKECDHIECAHGEPKADSMECTCEAPYSGIHCDELETKNVYSLYNNWAVSFNPLLLSLTIIPLIFLVWGCNAYSKKRRAKKVEHLLESEVNRDLKSSHVQKLLYGK